MASVYAISVSDKKGVAKQNVTKAALQENFGILGDAHAGEWHRQISLLALESIKKMQDKGLAVAPGSFAENVTTEGLDLLALPVGSRIRLGHSVILEITQHGKKCHTNCAIYEQAGDCVMPKEGVFARVIKGGELNLGDAIEVLYK